MLVHKILLLSNIFYQVYHFCLFQFFLSSFHYMLSNKLQFSPTIQYPHFSKTQHPQPSTSETLTQLSSGNSLDSQFYFDNQHTDLQLIQYTLNLGPSSLSSLQYLTENLYRKANDQMQSQKTQCQKIQYIQNLEKLSELSTVSLIKIGEQRKRIRQKLLGYLLIKSKQTNKKTIIKSNILKCKQALEALKKLKDQNFQTEQQIMHFKLRLTTCGLILVPGLIEKCIIGLTFKVLLQKKVRLAISEASNLRIIIEGFLENQDIMQKAWLQFFKQNLVEHSLYAKFKIFIILKTYIDDRCNGNKLFQLFMQAIQSFLKRNINKFTLIQHNKIQSLVQSDQNLRIFWQNTAKSQIQHTLIKTISFISEMQKKNQKLKYIFDQLILNRNKGFRDPNKLKVSKESTKFILESDLFPSIQSINALLTIVAERKGFFRNAFIQHNLEVSTKDIQFCIAFHCLKSFLYPLKNMVISMNSLTYRDKKQKHYHNYRFVHRNLLVWQKILNQFEYQSQKTMEILKKLRSTEQNKGIIKQLNIKQEKQKLSNSKSEKEQQMISICELFIHYNNTLGERYLYTANKLANSIVQDSEFSGSSINMKNKRQLQMGLEHLMGLWVSLIGEKVCDHLLYELQPANVLPKIRFLQDEIVQTVERQHKIENQLNKLWKEVQKMARSKRSKDSTDEQVHSRVWQFNLKTRNYEKLLLISKFIKVDNELKEMNEKIYKQIFSTQFK